MEEIRRYSIVYTETAIRDMEEKWDYLALQRRNIVLADRWYERLRSAIQRELTTFPMKYPPYNVEPWRERGVREFVTKTDVILYQVDQVRGVVYIRAVCTIGRDLDARLDETEDR
jgi:toxin ParE1/3/4